MQFFRNRLRSQCRLFSVGLFFLWSAVVVGQIADENQPATADAGVVIEAVTDPAGGESETPETDSGRVGADVIPSRPDNLLVYYIKALGETFVIVFVGLSFALVALLVMCFLQFFSRPSKKQNKVKNVRD